MKPKHILCADYGSPQHLPIRNRRNEYLRSGMQEATAVTLSEGESHPLKAAGRPDCSTVLFSFYRGMNIYMCIHIYTYICVCSDGSDLKLDRI